MMIMMRGLDTPRAGDGAGAHAIHGEKPLQTRSFAMISIVDGRQAALSSAYIAARGVSRTRGVRLRSVSEAVRAAEPPVGEGARSAPSIGISRIPFAPTVIPIVFEV